jgi:hypothetical protein
MHSRHELTHLYGGERLCSLESEREQSERLKRGERGARASRSA